MVNQGASVVPTGVAAELKKKKKIQNWILIVWL